MIDHEPFFVYKKACSDRFYESGKEENFLEILFLDVKILEKRPKYTSETEK